MTVVGGILCLLLGVEDPALGEAYSLWLKGDYREAFEKYEGLKTSDPVAVALGKSRCLRSEGKYAEAGKELAEALKKKPDQADLLAATADLLFLQGKLKEAAAVAEKAVAKDDKQLSARWTRAQVLAATGKGEQANTEYKWFIDYYNSAQPEDAEKLVYVARAATEFARRNKLHDEYEFILNTLLPDALKANPDYWQAKFQSGALLVDKYNKQQGVPDLQGALKLNPMAVEAIVALGNSSLQEYDFKAVNTLADQALEINPSAVEALWLKADALVADERTPEAVPLLEKALKTNPVSEGTLGRLAACRYLSREPAKTAELEKQALALNPKPGEFYSLLGDVLERRRQFDDAEKYYLKAIEAAPYLAGPRNGLGMLYMRVGREDDARKVFKAAREIDPYHVRVMNMVKVLEHLEGYRIFHSKHYDVYVAKDVEASFGKYISDFLESVHPTLVKRFGYEPKAKSKIEIMSNHQWFSGRVVGVPSIGTVGACTGKVVALTSPTSMKNQKFNWARVLTHEVTHIITLEQTNFNIPHWYTEALAVISEDAPRNETWNELLLERVPKGDLFNLDNINNAFIRPKTPLDWQMAYCQSLLYAQYMQERFGEDALARLLDAYAKGMETNVAVPRTFKVDKADFEKGYLAYLKKIVAGMKSWPTPKAKSFAEAEREYREKPADPDRAAALALHYFNRKNPVRARELAEEALKAKQNHPGAVYVLARMEVSIGKLNEAVAMLKPALAVEPPNQQVFETLAGVYLKQKKYAEAQEVFEKAYRLDPIHNKWLEGIVLTGLKRQEAGQGGDPAKLKASLEKLAFVDGDNVAVRKKLAELEALAKKWDRAEYWAKQTLYIDVTDEKAHRQLAEAAFAAKHYPVALAEYEWLQAKNPEDSSLSVDAAEAALAMGNAPKARQLLREVVKAKPDDARAKKLLKEALDK